MPFAHEAQWAKTYFRMTKLTETQWQQERTPEFNAWFDDWEDAGEPRDNLIFVKNLSPARVVTVSLEVGED